MDRKFVNKVLTPVFLSSFSSSFCCCVYLLGANAVVLVVLISTCIIVFLFLVSSTCLTALLLCCYISSFSSCCLICLCARARVCVCVSQNEDQNNVFDVLFFLFRFALLSSPLIFYTYLKYTLNSLYKQRINFSSSPGSTDRIASSGACACSCESTGERADNA